MGSDDLTSAPVPSVGVHDHVRGPAEEAVVLYADFTCPRCAQAWFALGDRPLAFRHFALRTKHPRAVPLACAAEAAAAQGAFWPFADGLFGDQGRQDDPHLWARCEALGLDLDRFEADRRSDAVVARVKACTRDGMRAGVMATPALHHHGVWVDWTRSDPEDS